MPRKTAAASDHEIEVLQAQIAILNRREHDFVRILDDMARLRDSVKSESMALASQVTALQRQRNPINWLPSELLIHIFLSLAEDDSDPSAVLAYNPSPVIISHVCQKWRKLAFDSSTMWSRISFTCRKWIASPVCTFMDRSGLSLLDFTFSPPPYHVDDLDAAAHEKLASQGLINTLKPQLFRVRSITFRCTCPASMRLMVETLVDNLHDLKSLRSLDLSLTDLRPSSTLALPLGWDDLRKPPVFDTPSVLTRLRLQQLPLRLIPSWLIRPVRTLELSYPSPRSQRGSLYTLRMSHVHRFLSFTPEIQHLVLIEATSLRDVVLAGSTEGQTENRYAVVSPIELPKLRTLTWKLAYPRDVHTFMSFFALPTLERWDILVADSPSKRNDVSMLRGNHWHEPDSYIQAEPLSGVLSMNALKELYVSCQDGDSLISSLRQFLFPKLEQLEFAHAGKCPPDCEHKHPLPRLDYIFRDPRLPHLTHFTLSHLDVFAGHGKLMLSYMPNLISLTLISCTGLDNMLQALAEAYGCAPDAERKDGRGCGVRVCPKLQEIALWSCHDFEFKSLSAVVYARAQPPGNVLTKAQKDVPSADVVSAVLGRKIRPLKKSRVTSVQGGASPAKSRTQSPSDVSSTLIPIEEALRPVRIACVHVDDCPQLTEDEALSLEDFGTVVVYR
jgi:hypothetical protein